VAHFGPSRPITESSSTFGYRSHCHPPIAPPHRAALLAALPPSLSRTSLAPHQLPSPIQCRNRWGLKIHRRWPPPLPSPPRPIKGTPSIAAPHRTSSHFLFRLSVPPLAPHQAPPLSFVPLCRRPYLDIDPVTKDLGEVPRLPSLC
jgi:hypothetical protein